MAKEQVDPEELDEDFELNDELEEATDETDDEDGLDNNLEEDAEAEPAADEDAEEPSSNTDDDEGTVLFYVEDEQGNEQEEEYSYDELKELVIQSKKPRLSAEQESLLRQVVPFVSRVQQSPVLQYVHYWLDQGLSEQAILHQLYGALQEKGYGTPPKQEEVVPEFQTQEELLRYAEERALQRLKAEQEPLKKTVEDMQLEKQTQAVMTHNNSVLANALKKHGWDPDRVDTNHVNKMTRKMSELYPNMQIHLHALSQPQANALIKEALGYRGGDKRDKARQSVKNISKNAKAPKSIRGNTQAPRQDAPTSMGGKYVSASDVQSNLSKLFTKT